MPSQSVSLVQDLYAAFGRGDVPAILAQLAPDVEWEVVGRRDDYPTFGVRHGQDGVGEFFALLAEHEAYSDFTPLSFHDAGDTVLVLGRAAYELKATGKRVATDWAHVFTLRDGKVAGFREFYDTAQVAEAYRR